ncbi:TPA: restriction endonuclease subunit S [Vibrio cholerae]|nr:restriction endonuclease subunit S [Vibrio cholerae]
MAPQESKNWIELSIGDIADVIAGGTPQAGNPDNFQEPGTGIAWLTPADLSGYKEKYISLGARDLSQQGYDSSSAKLLPKGSIVFSSRAPIGYVAIAKNDISTNQGFKNFVFTHGVDSSFAYHYLRSIKDIAESLGTGTTFKEISGATAKTLPFVLPPLAEQKVIADKLDTLLAQVETTKARLERIPQILKTFRQSVLASAVSGKLTEEWRLENPSLEPISLDDIETYWSVKYLESGKKRPSLKFIETALLTEVPTSWINTNIGYVFDVYVGATPSRKNEDFWNGDIPWVSSSEVAFCRISSTKETVTKLGLAKTSTNIHPPGTVMLAMIGQGKTRGQVAILDIEACHNQNTAALRVPTDFVVSEYLYFYLTKQYEETRRVGGGNNQQALNKSVVQSLEFPLPPFEEQTEIVRRIEELFAFAERIEQKANAALEHVNHLTQAILAKAFRGELTADWRAANPELISGENSAEALLKKIQVEREAVSKKKAVRKRV